MRVEKTGGLLLNLLGTHKVIVSPIVESGNMQTKVINGGPPPRAEESDDTVPVRKYIGVFALAYALAIGLVTPCAAKDLTNIAELQPPPWPFYSLSTAEREARLRFFMDTQNYQLENAREPMTEVDCEELLERLEDPEGTKILKPDITVQSRDDPRVPNNLIYRCSALEFDRIWFSQSKSLSADRGTGSDFDSLALDKKDAASDFYYKKTGPIEFYDLSRFYNDEPTWGTFADAGEIVCNDNYNYKLCSKLEGYRLIDDTVIGPVVNEGTCEAHLHPKVMTGTRMIVTTEYPYAYNELPSFHAFAQIDKDLYRLGMHSLRRWMDLHKILYEEGSTTFYAEPASLKKKGGLCVYRSTNSQEDRK
ncbi:MAG: hypothetical protein EOM12_16995 [Verrucomicrobiae bacterium]|nr:hypothetical protein [Verrucomicrobiae bacterium]